MSTSLIHYTVKPTALHRELSQAGGKKVLILVVVLALLCLLLLPPPPPPPRRLLPLLQMLPLLLLLLLKRYQLKRPRIVAVDSPQDSLWRAQPFEIPTGPWSPNHFKFFYIRLRMGVLSFLH